jgi:hypothetical protein
MEPKDKAKELVKKYYYLVSEWTSTNLPNEIPTAIYEGEEMKIGRAKECAMIAVNEILQTNPTIKGTSEDLITMIIQTKSYWYQVQNEINKL